MNKDEPKVSCNQIHIVEKLIFVGKVMMSKLDEALEEAGLSEAKFWALKHLIEASDCLGVTQLADCMGSAKSNATQIIDRLEAEGLVQRVPNPDDRRSVLVNVTDEGLARYQAAIEVRIKAADAIVNGLDETQRTQLSTLLDTIHNSL